MTTQRTRRKPADNEPDRGKKASDDAGRQDPESEGAETDAPSAEARIKELNDQLLRLRADFDNYRKRTLREREAERLRSNEDLMMEMLPILDHLEMGLRTAEEHAVHASVIQGFQMVLDQALGALRKFGLEPIDAEGEPFDPHHHESVSMAPSDEVPHEHVLSQLRRGYRLGAQLLRPAQVVLSLGPEEKALAPAGEDDDAWEKEPPVE